MESFWNFVVLDLLVSWPETFTIWYLAFALLEQPASGLYKRIALLVVSTSIYTDALIRYLPLHLHLVNSLFCSALMLALLFRKTSLKRKIGILVTAYLIGIVTDLATSSVFVFGWKQPPGSFMEDGSLAYMLLALYPVLAVEWLAAWYVRRRGLKRIRSLLDRVVDHSGAGISPLVLFILLQFGLLATIEILIFLDRIGSRGAIVPGLIGGAIVLGLVSLVLVLRLIGRTREETARMAQDVYVEEINRMFTSIRGQRHDFLNHVQVMHTMLQMGKTAELKAYMAEVVKETHAVNAVVQHGSPALAAFVQAKTAVAVSRGILFTCELSDEWQSLSTIRMIDIVKIVGNLVNNAFDESELLPPADRLVHASMRCDSDRVELVVTNRVRSLEGIDPELLFAPGYTTKSDRHSGLGLPIVQERVKHYRGTIEVRTMGTDTIAFHVVLPRSGSGLSTQAG